jgi:signal peptidase I
MEAIKRAVAAFFDFLQGIVVVLALLVMVYLFLVSPQEINGASMEPTFFNGEYILTNKVAYKLREAERGDVVIFKSPRNKEIDYIKRVIGLPGDIVRLEANSIYVNAQKIDEPYLNPDITIFGGSYLQEGQEVIVPPGSYFVLGDNRPHSSDSREFGPIPLEDIIGVAFLRYWPFDKAGMLTEYRYDNVQ